MGPRPPNRTATGVPLIAQTASCDMPEPELPSPQPCLAHAQSRPAENRLTHTYRPTAATSRGPDIHQRRHGGHSTHGGRQATAAPESRPSGATSPRAARGFLAAETGPPLPPNHPHAAAPTKAPPARYRRAQSPTMAIYEPVPARVPLHLGISRANSLRQLTATSPCCWEPPPTAPEPMARHAGRGPPALCLPSPPRRWTCGQRPERGGGLYPHLTTRGVVGPSM